MISTILDESFAWRTRASGARARALTLYEIDRALARELSRLTNLCQPVRGNGKHDLIRDMRIESHIRCEQLLELRKSISNQRGG